MRWTSWLPSSQPRPLCVLGLDIGPQSCAWVVLSGTPNAPTHVCAASRVDMPDAWVVQGHVVQPEALGQWVRHHLQAGDHQPDCVYLSFDHAHMSQHGVALAVGLSPEDVAFQLQAEVQSKLPTDVGEVCLDYQRQSDPDPMSEPASTSDAEAKPKRAPPQQRYAVQAVPQALVAALQRVAQAARLRVRGIEPRAQAIQRTAQPHVFADLPAAGVALALQCPEAFGLALRAWHDEGPNFSPYRAQAQQDQRRAWIKRLALPAVAGMVMAAGVAVLLDTLAHTQQPEPSVVAASARDVAVAQTAHAQARWLATQQAMQAQSLQWGQVLSQASSHVWVARVTQQEARWTVQGEALSNAHAQQLLAQLKALSIWAQAPELTQLQRLPAASSTGLAVWQFRIDAHLKAGV
jgi:hypothetical protein